MGGACSTHERDEKRIQHHGWKTLVKQIFVYLTMFLTALSRISSNEKNVIMYDEL
jgi:hypothetical protein